MQAETKEEKKEETANIQEEKEEEAEKIQEKIAHREENQAIEERIREQVSEQVQEQIHELKDVQENEKGQKKEGTNDERESVEALEREQEIHQTQNSTQQNEDHKQESIESIHSGNQQILVTIKDQQAHENDKETSEVKPQIQEVKEEIQDVNEEIREATEAQIHEEPKDEIKEKVKEEIKEEIKEVREIRNDFHETEAVGTKETKATNEEKIVEIHHHEQIHQPLEVSKDPYDSDEDEDAKEVAKQVQRDCEVVKNSEPSLLDLTPKQGRKGFFSRSEDTKPTSTQTPKSSSSTTTTTTTTTTTATTTPTTPQTLKPAVSTPTSTPSGSVSPSSTSLVHHEAEEETEDLGNDALSWVRRKERELANLSKEGQRAAFEFWKKMDSTAVYTSLIELITRKTAILAIHKLQASYIKKHQKNIKKTSNNKQKTPHIGII
eukprot:TRINITY_DN573_c0_g2_i1.p1 TRINITY_DN573_c0_g2~~TRINITY_DN573_c0_g2_i1.p1  ORF type:complete len:436 (-),score=143.93 TRINITY_DN573_c0_g2_i1:333-1640(-)